MKHAAHTFAAFAILVAEIASVGMATTLAVTPVAAQNATQEQRQIARQRRLILQQQREILDNQRRLAGQKEQVVERSPVTGEAIDTSKLPKGLLSGILPSCPLGFAYNAFVGCVIYVAH